MTALTASPSPSSPRLAGLGPDDTALTPKLLRRIRRAGLTSLDDLARVGDDTLVALTKGKTKHIAALAKAIAARPIPAPFGRTPPLADVRAALATLTWTAEMIALQVARWGAFVAWAQVQDRRALPASADVVARYLQDLPVEDRKPRLAMIAAVHRLYGHPFDRRDASIRLALAAPDPYRGPKGRARPRAITRDDLVQLFPNVARRPDPTRTCDLALFCLGYATGLTAPELAMLQADSVIGEDDGGLTVICLNLSPDHPLRTGRFRLEPTDDPFCAVAAIKRLKFETRNESQPLFRSTTDDAMPRTPGEITAIIRGRVRRAGLDPRRITDRSFLYGWKALAAEYIAETRIGDDEATENRAA